MLVHCCQCGVVFESDNLARHFCTPECHDNFLASLDTEKYCVVCGKKFTLTNYRYSAKRTCSAACRAKRKSVYAKDRYIKELLKTPRHKTLWDYAREADECGLSYGKYRAALNMGKTYEELKAAYEESRQ